MIFTSSSSAAAAERSLTLLFHLVLHSVHFLDNSCNSYHTKQSIVCFVPFFLDKAIITTTIFVVEIIGLFVYLFVAYQKKQKQ